MHGRVQDRLQDRMCVPGVWRTPKAKAKAGVLPRALLRP